MDRTVTFHGQKPDRPGQIVTMVSSHSCGVLGEGDWQVRADISGPAIPKCQTSRKQSGLEYPTIAIRSSPHNNEGARVWPTIVDSVVCLSTRLRHSRSISSPQGNWM